MSKFLPLLPVIILLSCHTPQKAQTPRAFVTWEQKHIELGAVKKGEKRSMVFGFTNTSGEKIQIDIVDACDCTKVDFPRGEIAPGQKAQLNVIFDSSEKDASETISINVIFKNTHPNGVPYIETVEYLFDLVK